MATCPTPAEEELQMPFPVNFAQKITATQQRLTIAIACLGLLIPAEAVFAELPADLNDAVEYQKRNKPALIAKLQQRAILQRKEKNNEGANQTKKLADAVRANKAIALPRMGEAGDLPGTIDVEEVIEKTDAGYRIATHLPRLQPRGGVNVVTGAKTTRPELGSEFIYYPEKIHIATDRELQKGERINARKTQDGYAEIPAAEMEQAAELLKKK
jgi:hypothetical protein